MLWAWLLAQRVEPRRGRIVRALDSTGHWTTVKVTARSQWHLILTDADGCRYVAGLELRGPVNVDP